jgi:hypothetical protein
MEKAMLTIRQEQIDAFKPSAVRKFEDDMVDHLKKFAPKRWKSLGEPGVREVIRFGINRARKYGFSYRGPVRFYIELMFMFGGYFDTDPQHPWVTPIFKDPKMTDQMIRADRLYKEMNNYLGIVSGPEHKFLIEAMNRLSQAKLEDFLTAGTSVDRSILAKLQQIYPEKCDYLGRTVLGTILQTGFEVARDYELTQEKGVVLTVVLAFALGHGFPSDPLYRWIGTELADKSRPDPNVRIDELYSNWKIHLDSLLEEGSQEKAGHESDRV